VQQWLVFIPPWRWQCIMWGRNGFSWHRGPERPGFGALGSQECTGVIFWVSDSGQEKKIKHPVSGQFKERGTYRRSFMQSCSAWRPSCAP